VSEFTRSLGVETTRQCHLQRIAMLHEFHLRTATETGEWRLATGDRRAATSTRWNTIRICTTCRRQSL